MRRVPFRGGLGSALLGASVPYGYTVTIFCSGQAVIHAHGSPSTGRLLLFAAGAATAFAAMLGASRHSPAVSTRELAASPHLLRALLIQALAIAAALTAAELASRLPSASAWPAASFAATSLYLAGVGLELALSQTDDRGNAG